MKLKTFLIKLKEHNIKNTEPDCTQIRFSFNCALWLYHTLLSRRNQQNKQLS